jgi:DNA-binding NarL/FixJ family response regulator
MAEHPLRILVVEPDVILRSALLAFLEALDDLVPVGSTSTITEAIQICQTLSPEVILMEIQLPDMKGIEAIRHLRQQCPGVAIVVLTSANQSDLMRDALLAGATGWLEKWVSVDQVVAALHIARQKATHHSNRGG